MFTVVAFDTPIGRLEIHHDEQHIHLAHFSELQSAKLQARKPSGNKTAFCQKIAVELEHYFKSPQHRFQLPLKPQGSAYQQQVWSALLVIPSGRTVTYGDLANQLQSSPRAVGQACKKNPLTLFIPCHRVVGKESLGGYMGNQNALSFKEALLKHEGSIT